MAFDESLVTASVDQQDFFSTTLKQTVADGTDTNIYLNTLPTPTEGFLTIEPTTASKREIIYYTSLGADYVTVPSAANGRGIGGTTAQGHTSGVEVRLTDVAEYWRMLKKGYGFSAGTASVGIPASAVRTTAWTAHTASLTGFSGTPTQANAYMQIGKLVIFRFNISGTSNAATFTMTLPVATKAAQSFTNATGTDNSAIISTPIRIDTTAASTTATLYTSAGTSVWTSSGTKSGNGILVYEAN